jgi:hypothetical protein
MLTLEQYRNKEMADLLNQYLLPRHNREKRFSCVAALITAVANTEDRGMPMNIKINDTDFFFDIFAVPGKHDINDDWCGVKVYVKNDYFTYQQEGELFEVFELKAIVDKITDLLTGRLMEETNMEFTEPDFEIKLHPKVDLRTTGKISFIREGCEFQDVNAEFIINLTDASGAYGTGEFYTITIEREELTAFLNYLRTRLRL